MQSPVLFMLAADSRLCAYRLNTTLDAGPVTKPVEVPYVSCIYFEPAPPLSANRQPIDLGKIVVDAASSTVFVQGRHASFRNGPAGYWNLGVCTRRVWVAVCVCGCGRVWACVYICMCVGGACGWVGVGVCVCMCVCVGVYECVDLWICAQGVCVYVCVSCN